MITLISKKVFSNTVKKLDINLQNYKYVDLSVNSKRFFANTAPVLFGLKFTPPIILDNIQYAPELLPLIKEYIVQKGKREDFILISNDEEIEKINNLFQDIGDNYKLIDKL